MYVKSLTLKGFKSFASATHLRLEPGITCIVGPNGSGKSNVVDALAWVMGEQGAKSLRGGKMEDVIFAGTAGRPPLGRAEVSMTIDNTDGALPIDYTEVTISRTMFRNGGSEYAINGTHCRLLDVQELLSDSGIGREMHVIVGQGQLDTVLRATPEERRGFIEEAAGVLKHRKRKEKALRKLDAMEANLARLADLTTEIRRQLGPLGRQAEAARRAAVIQADARDARLRLLADDLVQLTSALEQEVADETALLRQRAELEEALLATRERISAHEQTSAEAAPLLAAAHDRWVRLQSLAERIDSAASMAADRVRLLSRDDSDERTTGRDPDELRAQAERARKDEELLRDEIARVSETLAQAVEAREEAERAYTAEHDRLARLARAAADRREGLARLAGQVGARRSRVEAAEAEIGRLRALVETATERAANAEREFTALESTIADEEGSEEGLDAAYERTHQAHADAALEVERWQQAERDAERDRTSAQARVEALELSLRRKDGAAALREAAKGDHDILGSLAELVQVTGGHEAAVAAALGWASEALAVGTAHAAARAVEQLRADDAGRATLIVGETARPISKGEWPALPSGATWAVDVIEAPASVRPAVEQVLERVAIVETTEDAIALLEQREGVSAVTADGDLYAPGVVHGGSSAAPSTLELAAALDEAREAVADATRRGEQAGFSLAAARTTLAERAEAMETAMEALHESDARMAAVAEQLGSHGLAMRSARAEAERTQRSIAELTGTLESGRAELAELEARLTQAEAAPAEEQDEQTDDRDRLEIEASRARTAETEVRLSLRTKEERARALHGRAESLEGAARNEIAARERLRARQEQRRREAETASAVETAARWAVGRVRLARDLAQTERAAAEEARTERDRALAELRTVLAAQQDQLRDVTDSVHRDEVARAQQVARIEQMQTRAIEELGMDPDVLMDEYGPHQLVPHVAGPEEDPEADDFPEPAPYVREVQEKRLRTAERGLRALGRVNPLALEEFAALEERHTFLTTQLEDLRQSKKDLLGIVAEVDQRVEQVFSEAFADTAEQFEGVFARLFPGGQGRLILTDPSDMLTTGIEVEARPPGKKVKRLSLLSGGERSLVAVALLVAIFKARPSPFYIMDEVEAALDDTNLGRLITLFEELRDSSQLIVITHQKKTMEVADALYGVSMRGDGITAVVSQRVRDVSTA
ncbi:chromosome segregation protein SMC [Janibacter sp. GXQ6167]|uniref:chromosome segregation protein SMC n=1 Tax=Janibacter sp. GXQ6167 TaxID=3240791 RepID=UPI0035236694